MDQDARIADSKLPLAATSIGPWQFSLRRLFVWTAIAAPLCFLGAKAGWPYAAVVFPTCAAIATARSVEQGSKRALVAFFFITAPLAYFVNSPLTSDGPFRVTRVKTEIDVLHQAILFFKFRNGEYPPNFNDAAAVNRFWGVRFPYSQESPPANLDPAEALVFWLSGFSSDRTKPLTGGGVRQPYFQFDPNPLKGTYPHQVYLPNRDGMHKPFVYFDKSRSYSSPPQYENLTPYVLRGNGGASDGFQIICAGDDNDFGRGGNFPLDAGHSEADEDNLTDFTRGVLGEACP